MRRVATALVFSLVTISLVTISVAGCASRAPGRPAAPARSAASALSAFSTVFATQPGGTNPEASIPNPGTGKGDLTLVKALLPQTAAGRAAALLLPPAIVALPDTDPRSFFIGLRQFSSPVAGPPECLGWTAGLWQVALASFNRSGVQLAITEQSVPSTSGLPLFSEAIIMGPARVLAALADPPLPAACRAITSQTSYPGGVRPLALARHGLRSRAYEVTGTGRVPVWQWAEVVSGPGFVLEVRIPDQSPNPVAPVQLPAITAAAYQRAVAVLSASRG